MEKEIFLGIQLFFTCIVGIYFFIQLKNQFTSKSSIVQDAMTRYKPFQQLRQVHLTEPLAEKLRPKKESDIIGQTEGIKALKTALCSSNPQHILIYGSPGIGKTAAARIVLDIAKNTSLSPFGKSAPFIEMDATTLRFDERSIADPLMGSVHDPIYQGAGVYGSAGVPQPKPGAVTKAHGGILFIDEIGELPNVQLNKLLKVLEDRKVFLDSSYYSQQDGNIPAPIHDIFQNGLPADFRLIGATTRTPEEIPAALRSRCVEIFFKDLSDNDLYILVENVVERESIIIEEEAKKQLIIYAQNGRDVVNMLQTAYSLIMLEDRKIIEKSDIEWVIHTGSYKPKYRYILTDKANIGLVHGLAVTGHGKGMILPIEVIVQQATSGQGKLTITGIVEEEIISYDRSKLKRKSMIYSSIENVLTIFKMRYNIEQEDYFIHFNFPSGIPVDGPSAGIAIFCALYSAFFNVPIQEKITLTGEVSLSTKVCPVGGVYEKVVAAKEANAKLVIVPQDNYEQRLEEVPINVIPVASIDEVIEHLFPQIIDNEASDILHA